MGSTLLPTEDGRKAGSATGGVGPALALSDIEAKTARKQRLFVVELNGPRLGAIQHTVARIKVYAEYKLRSSRYSD
ncbi:hypothetical protein, partial [Sinorhizobium meliloti]|uniref:hypothetical protein n=1 Tax=Rhizobium meliloti TaxID=382 RepID=UPI001AEDF5BD